MPAAIFNIDFEQGAPRDLTVAEWLDDAGNRYSLDGCKSRFICYQREGDTAYLIDLSTDNQIEILNGQITVHFQSADTAKLAPLSGAHPIPPVVEAAKKYKAGYFEWWIWNAQGTPFPLARGEVNVTPSKMPPGVPA